MSTRYLKYFFQPQSITVVGAAEHTESFGGVVLQNLLNSGFEGQLTAINKTRYKTVFGVPCYRSAAKLPGIPDLAIVCTPGATVPRIIKQLGKKGIKATLVLMGGLSGQLSKSGRPLKESALAAARPFGMRLMGPNSLGILAPGHKMNASYAHLQVLPGKVGFVGQSAMLGSAIIDWACGRDIGFSHFLTLGDTMDVDLADVIDFLAGDRNTRAVLLHIEHVARPERFISAVRAASRTKPVLAFKSGVSIDETFEKRPPGLPDDDRVWDEVFRRSGTLRVHSAERLFNALETLTRLKPFHGERMVIMGNGGGPNLTAHEALLRQGGIPATLSKETHAALKAVLPPICGIGNPIDLNADADPTRYAKALEIVNRDSNVDAILVVHAPTLRASGLEFAKAIIQVDVHSHIMTSWMGMASVTPARKAFDKADIPTYETAEEAVRAFMDRVRHERNQALLRQSPGSAHNLIEPQIDRAATALKSAKNDGRRFLNPLEVREVLAAYDIPYAQTLLARNAQEAITCAQELESPVALKIISNRYCAPFSYNANPKIWRRGIAVDLETPNQIKRAALRLENHLHQLYPSEKTLGFLVQKMRRGPGSVLINFAITRDPVFGPLILFGEGGNVARTLADRQVSLPPLNMGLAGVLLERTKVLNLLRDTNEKTEAIEFQIKQILTSLSQMIVDFPEISGLEINPFLIRGKTMMALDAAISIGDPIPSAIKPRPRGLEEQVVLKSGKTVTLRPIQPEDEPAHRKFADGLSKEAIRFRFFTSISRLSHRQLVQLTQIDYLREMAFIATASDQSGKPETLGVVRTWTDPDGFSSEFAVIIREDLYGQGLGSKLIDKIIRYCRECGVTLLTGTILPENRPMQGLAKHMGFSMRLNIREQVMEANLQLREPKDDWQKQRLADILSPSNKT